MGKVTYFRNSWQLSLKGNPGSVMFVFHQVEVESVKKKKIEKMLLFNFSHLRLDAVVLVCTSHGMFAV